MQNPFCYCRAFSFAYLAVDNHTPADFCEYLWLKLPGNFPPTIFFWKKWLENIFMEFTENIFSKIKILLNLEFDLVTNWQTQKDQVLWSQWSTATGLVGVSSRSLNNRNNMHQNAQIMQPHI